MQTDWERSRGLSLVVNFYYPRSEQARGPLAPWEDSAELVFIGDTLVPAAQVRFYRLARPPSDLAD